MLKILFSLMRFNCYFYTFFIFGGGLAWWYRIGLNHTTSRPVNTWMDDRPFTGSSRVRTILVLPGQLSCPWV